MKYDKNGIRDSVQIKFVQLFQDENERKVSEAVSSTEQGRIFILYFALYFK